MAEEENKELMNLLDRLKSMKPAEPGSSEPGKKGEMEKAVKEEKPGQNDGKEEEKAGKEPSKRENQEKPAGKTPHDGKGAAKRPSKVPEAPKKGQDSDATTLAKLNIESAEIFKKIDAIEGDLSRKGKKINEDLGKLTSLLDSLEQNQAIMVAREKEELKHEAELNKALRDMKKIKVELKKFLD